MPAIYGHGGLSLLSAAAKKLIYLGRHQTIHNHSHCSDHPDSLVVIRWIVKLQARVRDRDVHRLAFDEDFRPPDSAGATVLQH